MRKPVTAARVLAGGRMVPLLDRIAQKYRLTAPVREDGVLLYRRVDGGGEVCLDFGLPLVPPKTHFFPQTELLFSYAAADGLELKEPPGITASVLFGVRPCDLRGFAALEPVFGGRFRDVYYQDKREHTTVVGVSCTEVRPECFCAAYGGSPVDGQGADLMLTRVGESYLAEILTPKGEQLVRRCGEFFPPEGAEEFVRAKAALGRELEARFSRRVDLEGVKDKAAALFESSYWRKLAYRCLGCGICTYLCPTCHCFDIVDEDRGDQTGTRWRCWDSCMFRDFTLHTSGHNPRGSKMERVRNRFLHKLSYHLDRHGLPGCVGCGRCIAACPVNIDITRVIAEIKEVE